MEELVKYYSKIARGLDELSGDIGRMIVNLKQKEEEETGKEEEKEGEKKEKRTLSLKSFQPMTRIRASKKEIIEANENKETTFILDKLGDIFKE
jgi:hypothetical protein